MGWGLGGSEPTPQTQADACFLDCRRGHRTYIVFFYSLGNSRKTVVGSGGLSLFPPSHLLPNQTPHRASLLQDSRVLLLGLSRPGAPGGARAGDMAEAAGPPGAELIPLAANSRSAGL